MDGHREKVVFIWSIAELLRGDYKQSEYGRVVLPLTVLRRLDSVLEPTKEAVLARHKELKGKVENLGPVLEQVTGHGFYNVSKFTFRKLLDDPSNVADNLRRYIAGFDEGTREVIQKFDFDPHIQRLNRSNLLYLVLSRFADIDFHPDRVSNVAMGYIYEELIRRFSELSNETAGEHFTPREVIRLMVNILFASDRDVLSKRGVVRTLYDPACGTGGMLSVAEDYLRELTPGAKLRVFGQELNDETYAICRSDMMIKGQDPSNIHSGNSFAEDGVPGQTFDYMLANPPFGVDWKKVADFIRDEHEKLGFRGRFGAGLPRIDNGALLFLQHMVSKMKSPAKGGTRLAIVFNASPLFTGSAGAGESEIRRWLIESDWLEAIVALPDQLFYNTGIFTYFWVLTNRKSPERRGNVQLIDGRHLWVKMKKSLGEKRKEIAPQQIEELTRLYADFVEGPYVRVFRNEELGYLRIPIDRPLRLQWDLTRETLATLQTAKSLQRLQPELRDQVMSSLASLIGTSTADEAALRDKIDSTLAHLGKLSKGIVDAVLQAAGLRNARAKALTDVKGNLRPDPMHRDFEHVPLDEDVEQYMQHEVLPFVPDAWTDAARGRVGYEIPITRVFYRFQPPRAIAEIDADIRTAEADITRLLGEITR